MDRDCRLDEGDALEGWAPCGPEEFEERRLGLGPSNLRPLDGERAENLWDDDVSALLPEAGIETTDPVEGLRRPIKDIESRLDFRGKILPLLVPAEAWRGRREFEVEGDARIVV